jgi:hypothetical protein
MVSMRDAPLLFLRCRPTRLKRLILPMKLLLPSSFSFSFG